MSKRRKLVPFHKKSKLEIIFMAAIYFFLAVHTITLTLQGKYFIMIALWLFWPFAVASGLYQVQQWLH